MPEPDTRHDPVTLHDFQEYIRERYFDTDSARGTPGTFMWLIEEIGELATTLQRSTVLDELGLWAEADAGLVSLLERPGGFSGLPTQVRAQIHTSLRLNPERLAPLLRQTLPVEEYYQAIYDNWSVAAGFQWLDLQTQERIFTIQLRGLRQAPTPASRMALEAYTELLQSRANARLAAGRVQAAQADVLHAVSLMHDFESRTGGQITDKRKRFYTNLASFHVQLAAILVAGQNIEDALKQVERVFEVSPMPDAHADFLARYPGLDKLHAHPRWRELVDARRGSSD